MIVTLAGWLYIVNAALVLLTLRSSLTGIALSGKFGTLLLGVGMGAIGVGLLKRETWGRWFALGPSFLGWTIGALFGLGMLALLFWFLANSSSLGGFAGFIGFLVVFTTVLSIAGVVINFKLYWHLMSEDGKEEFGAPESDSFVTVLQSAGVWIGAGVLSLMISGSGSLAGGALATVFASDEEKAHAKEFERQQKEEERRKALLDEEFRRRTAETSRRYNEQMERAARAAATERPGVANYNPEPAAAPQGAIAESPAPVTYAPPEEDKKIDTKRILKCRDSSGGVQFTQGYCPAGTKEVAAPNLQ